MGAADDPESWLIEREDRAAEELAHEPLLLTVGELSPMLARLTPFAAAVVLARAQGARIQEIASELRTSSTRVSKVYRRSVERLRFLVAHPLLTDMSEDEVRDTVQSLGVRIGDATVMGRFFSTASFERTAQSLSRGRGHVHQIVTRVLERLDQDGYRDEPVVVTLRALTESPFCLYSPVRGQRPPCD